MFFVIAAQPLAAFFNNHQLATLFYLTPLFLMIQGGASIAVGLLSRAHRIVEVEKSQTLYSTLINLLVSLLLALAGFDFMALVIGLLVGEMVCAIRLYCLLHHKFRVKFYRDSFLKIKSALKSYYYISFVSNFNQFIDQILIGKFLGVEAVGVYTRAVQLREYPLFVFSKTVVRVIFPVLSDIQESSERVKAAMLKTLNLTLLLLFPLTLFLSMGADAIVLVVLGNQWGEVIDIMSILMLGVPFMVCAGIFHSALKAANQESAIAKYLTVYSMVLIVTLLIGVNFGAMGIAAAVTLTAAIHCLNYATLYARILTISFTDYLKTLKDGIIFSIFNGVVLFLLQSHLAESLPFLKLLAFSGVFFILNVSLLLFFPSVLVSGHTVWLRTRVLDYVKRLFNQKLSMLRV